MDLGWFEIFRTGKHADSAGNVKNWTEEDLDRIVKNYDPAKHEAPIVIGHPTDNAPAYGWIESVKREGDKLFAKAKQVVPEFVEMVKNGLFKKRSISLYPDLTLRHVGFLGAIPPAVKGLADIKFESKEEQIMIEFEEGNIDKLKKEREDRAKKYGIGIKDDGNLTKPKDYENLDDEEFADPVNYKYPVDEAHIRAALSYWGMEKNRQGYNTNEIKTITKRILDAAKKYGIEIDESKWDFKENKEDKMTKEFQDKICSLEEEIKKRDVEISKLKSEIEAEKKERRKADENAFCDELIKEGKITPAVKKTIMEFFDILENVEDFDFSEGEKTEKKSPYKKFREFVSNFPKQIEFSEYAREGKNSGESDMELLHKRAKELSEKEKISYKDAVLRLSKKEE